MPRSSRPLRFITTFAIAAAFACGAPEQSRADSETDLVELELLADEFTGSFDERFSSAREIPTFARPEIAAVVLALPRFDEVAPGVVAEAEPDGPHHPPGQGVAAVDEKSPMQVVKELLIPPAQGAEPPSQQEASAASAAPRQDDRAATVAAAPSTDNARWTAGPVPSPGAEQVAAGGQVAAAPQAPAEDPAKVERRIAAGPASYYEHPGRTASGEVYDPSKLTAAHKSLPFGTRVRVVNRDNGRSIVVRINDRAPREMPFVIDLSRGSARALGISAKEGIAPVAVYKAE